MGRSRKHTEWHIGAASPECFLACKESFPEGEEFKFHDGNTTVFFFFCFFSSAFFVSAPFSSQSLPHSHSPAQFQANPKSSPNASHTSPEYIPNQKQTAVDNVPSLRDKVITHTGTRARNDTIRSSAMHFNKHQDIQAAAIQNATQIETGTVLHRLQGQLLHCPSFCTPQRNTYLAFNQQ